MESKTLTVAMPERMHRELATYAAALSAKTLRNGRKREYCEDALLLAAMDSILRSTFTGVRPVRRNGGASGSPPG